MSRRPARGAASAEILDHYERRFARAEQERAARPLRHVGLELKFPVVDAKGRACDRAGIDTFFETARESGWELAHDAHTGAVREARGGLPDNPDLIATTTGYCVLEFSVAHQETLHALESRLRALRGLAEKLRERTGCRLLGLGVHPVTPASPDLVARKGRHLFWDEIAPPKPGVHESVDGGVALFTTIADNQVHVDVSPSEATDAVNALNMAAAAQLALTANSSVWAGAEDPRRVAVRELYWDWWLDGQPRHGIPPHRFADLEDYVAAVAALRPVYVDRDGRPLSVTRYTTFLDYYADPDAAGTTGDGESRAVTPRTEDIDLHDRAFWWNARLSRFCTVESRVSCQQPPEELLAPAAFVLGLVERLEDVQTLLRSVGWHELHELRTRAAEMGLRAFAPGAPHAHVPRALLTIASEGLEARDRQEGRFLEPLRERLSRREAPARNAARVFRDGGIDALVEAHAWA